MGAVVVSDHANYPPIIVLQCCDSF